MSTKVTHFYWAFFSFLNKQASLADVNIMVWATDGSEYATFTLRVLPVLNYEFNSVTYPRIFLPGSACRPAHWPNQLELLRADA